MSSSSKPAVLHVSTHAGIGGAGRACLRILQAQVSMGAQSKLLCLSSAKKSPDIEVFEPQSAVQKLRMAQSALQSSRVKSWRSSVESVPNNQGVADLLPRINRANQDIVHLHWINGALSIEQIGAIKKPIVWTLHDMWAFCGLEHYSCHPYWRKDDGGDSQLGASHEQSKLNMNRLTLAHKLALWKPMTVVAPSTWLAHCASQSKLMAQWPITVIHHPIDTEQWHPVDSQYAKVTFGLPESQTLILYGAYGAMTNPVKGFDLLRDALTRLHAQKRQPHLLVFGQTKPSKAPVVNCKVSYLGEIKGDEKLRMLYGAVDMLVVPSRLEAFNQIAAEAQACGTPVVAFNNSGVADVVDHCVTGYLAQAFDTDDFAKGIQWSAGLTPAQRLEVASAARQRVRARFNSTLVASQYINLYETLLRQADATQSIKC